jgi:flagellar export protein FliJ
MMLNRGKMMAKLDSLLRLKDWQLDEARQELIELQNQMEDLTQHIQAFEKEVTQELSAAEEAGEIAMLQSLPGYLARAKAKREQLSQRSQILSAQIEQATEQVRESFLELKRLDIIDRQRKEAAEKEQARKDQIELDDMAAQRHGRAD